MHRKSHEKVFPSKIHELEAHEAQIVQGSDQLCNAFQTLESLLGVQ